MTPSARKSVCGHRKCRRLVTQAFDVGSWWSKSVFHGDNANVVHYEVCDKHAGYFTGTLRPAGIGARRQGRLGGTAAGDA